MFFTSEKCATKLKKTSFSFGSFAIDCSCFREFSVTSYRVKWIIIFHWHYWYLNIQFGLMNPIVPIGWLLLLFCVAQLSVMHMKWKWSELIWCDFLFADNNLIYMYDLIVLEFYFPTFCAAPSMPLLMTQYIGLHWLVFTSTLLW